MESLLILLVLGLIAWYALRKAKPRPGATARAEQSQERPKAGIPSTTRQSGDEEHTITVTVDWDRIQREADDFKKSRMRWSGRDYGPFPIKRLTDGQSRCLHDAVGRKRIVIGDPYAQRGEAPVDIEAHPDRTVKSLVKHGFLTETEKGIYICTDFGAKAWEELSR